MKTKKIFSNFNRQFQDKRQLRNIIDQKLVKSGEKERLKQLLRQRLTQCGWRDDLKAHCKDVVKGKGMDQVSVEDLINEITPKGRGSIGPFQ
ncbi:Transcription and mRNA export factor eny2 [Clydaea vesicula]|uniref:Transcription and mRNA export factor SUS1 n=1 Tax=Clydaea vesicula TaxID=447962 RepID=A0AAD5U259_9FUNG|nr:Transcription and mRNA export factor eny2 [Clydaea vesicula]